MTKIDNYFNTEDGAICCCVLIVFFVGSIIAYFIILPYGIPAIYFYFGVVIFLSLFFSIFVYVDALTYCEICKKRVRPIFKDHICELDKNKIQKSPVDKKDLILAKIKAFSTENPRKELHCLMLIKRIINFIEYEVPNTQKYEKFILQLQKQINSSGRLIYIFSEDALPVIKNILKDLYNAIELDSFESFSLDLHPKIKEVSLELYQNGHYSQAIFEAVKLLNNYVKKKANITDADLSNAMAKAFNERNPIIKLNKLITQSDKDEQEGFRFLFQGAMKGIRNPKGHEIHEMSDKNEALEYLAFISLLFRKAEQGIL